MEAAKNTARNTYMAPMNPTMNQGPPNLIPPEGSADAFYSDALERIRHSMLALALGLSAIVWWKFGRFPAIGFIFGCVIAYLNFHWLKSGIEGVADKVTQSGKAQSGVGIVGRFLLRYVLLGAAAYGILTSFPASLRGLFAGLFLPVAAIACEAVYELYASVTRGV
jgi:ATP synthase I chain